MHPKSIYHAAYRCNNMQETVDFYTKVVGLKYHAALLADHHPVTGAPFDFIHTFFELEDGSGVAFFEVADDGELPKPPVFQHLAIEVADKEKFEDVRRHLERLGVKFEGPVDHKATLSLYVRDPTGHVVEFALAHDVTVRDRQAAEKWDVLEAWNRKYYPELAKAK